MAVACITNMLHAANTPCVCARFFSAVHYLILLLGKILPMLNQPGSVLDLLRVWEENHPTMQLQSDATFTWLIVSKMRATTDPLMLLC